MQCAPDLMICIKRFVPNVRESRRANCRSLFKHRGRGPIDQSVVFLNSSASTPRLPNLEERSNFMALDLKGCDGFR